MPTGYTAPVADGEVTEFADFAMECARAFGALVTMRDSPEATIPDEFEPNTSYHDEKLAKAKADLEMISAMSAEECRRQAEAAFEKVREQRLEAGLERTAQLGRYEAMLAKVRQWTPPTPDHVGLKDFMVQQIEESIRFDCSPINWPEYPQLAPEEWRAERLAKAQRDIEYHTEERAKEVKRARERTEWVRALRQSLAGADNNVTEANDEAP